MFSIGLDFLNKRYYAQDPHRGQAFPEWPPHPDRLFSAMVASSYARSEEMRLNDAERAALEWFEALPAPRWSGPLYFDSTASSGRNIATFVPPNAVASKYDASKYWRPAQPRPMVSIAVSDFGYWIWPAIDPSIHRPALTRIIHGIARLGASASFVRCWIESDPPRETLVLAPAHSRTLFNVRLPYPGRLASLEAAFARDHHPTPTIPTAYVPPETVVVSEPPAPSPWLVGSVWLFKRPIRHDITSTLIWTNAFRQAVLARVGSLGPIPSSVHGHSPSSHIAFTALSDVGGNHSDGHLLGLALWMPSQISKEDQRLLHKALASLSHLTVGGHDYPLVRREAISPSRVLWGAKDRRWRGPQHGSKSWSSVTPVVFDRFPRSSHRHLLSVVNSMAKSAGFPPVTEVRLLPNPAVSGSAFADEFVAHRSRTTERPRFISHLSMTFSQPVTGPVILGRLRYFGMGLCIPEEGRNESDKRDDDEIFAEF